MNIVDFQDIAAIVDCFVASNGGPRLHWCDLSPTEPDSLIDFSDIGSAVDAFTGLPYPVEGPCP